MFAAAHVADCEDTGTAVSRNNAAGQQAHLAQRQIVLATESRNRS